MATPDASPFAVLDIAPTRDAAAIKRAYFTALAAHPPHRDPDGFKRIRSAYEALGAPGGAWAALLAEPLDIEAEARRCRERFDADLARAGQERADSEARASQAAACKERLLSLPLDEALAAFARPAGSGGK
jgi:curved DNA-binding protein CbpA